MARHFKPSAPFTVPMKLLVPTSQWIQGTLKNTYPNPEEVADKDALFFGSFRTFGGTESIQNGVYTIVDTATIDTWYRPDIKANCRIYLVESNEIYDIVADPEDIDKRHQYLQLKVRKVGGKA